ncbi:MAG: negative regulator for alginate biosynthesis [Gammaproteobacteria bacterium]|nr:MAG: negative regulator for alginate biosynthesis [Gammaproteobacteria bacterium]
MLQNLLGHRCLHVLLATMSVAMVGVASAAVCPGADATALSWLDKMSRSVRQVSYNGVVTLQRGDDMQVMQISHSVGEGTISERLTELTGQGAQVERADHPVACIHPGHKLLRVGADLQVGRCGIAQHYRFSVTDGERVAGRKAVRIRIEPRDMYRFGYVMELDRETALLLQAETVGRGSKTLEKFQFANLSYSGQILGGIEVNLVHEAQHPHPRAAATSAAPGDAWSVGWVPGGFASTDTPVGSSGRRTYTDGLAVFSVFLEQLGREIRPGEGVVRRGSTLSYTRGMHLAGRPVLITVIGEVPVNTARMVADSVDWTR